MGLLKWFFKHFKCKSNCSFNDTIFDDLHLQRRLTNYTLKQKDVQKILKILHKREYKDEFVEIKI